MAAGMLAAPSMVWSRANKKVGLQLYTLRELIGKDVPGVIAKVAAAGYKEVETYGFTPAAKYWGQESAAFGKILKDNGLTSPSGHYGMDTFLGSGNEDDLKAFAAAANTIGQRYITIPSMNDHFRRTPDDLKRTCEMLNKAGEICKRSGLKLGYHNHAAEFAALGDQTIYDSMLKHTDPALVYFQMDIYWVVRAGKDPVDLFSQYPGRFVMWHVKDMDKTNPARNTEVGNGSIDFKRIFAKAELSGVQHIIMEQENFDIDPYESIQASRLFISSKLL
jgi:sugar phosphate isomerase/epimerase